MQVKLKPEIKALWLEALRSGKYKQGQDQLRDRGNNFCCLGVLCNLHAQAHPKFAKKQKNPEEYDKSGGYPSLRVSKWAFENWTPNTDKDVEIKTLDTSLVKMNDGGESFKRIARVIDKHL